MQILDALITAVHYAFATLFVALSAFLPFLSPAVEVPTPAPSQPAAIATTTKIAKEQDSTQKQAEPTKMTTQGPVAESTPPTPPTTPSTVQNLPESEINAAARASLVNILCTTRYGGYLAPISGSGVIIDSRGVILTNAHVGQFFLLRDYGFKDNVQCVVRVGSPAAARYTAELLYLPEAWINANAQEIVATQAHGTGEYDYAFLRITGTTNPSGMLPTSFPALPMSTAYPVVGDQALLAGYPAGFLGGESITKELYQSSALAYVTQLFSYDDNTKKVDLFSVGGTVVSQAGSSGGAVVRMQDGKLSGIIATATLGNSTGTRDLRAVSLSHIDATLNAFGQGGLVELLTGNIAAKAASFNATTAASERATLFKYLDAQ